MTVELPKGGTLLGIPLVKVRNVLRAWRYGGSKGVGSIAKRKDVDLDPRLVMILLEELRDRDLIGPEDDGGHTIDGLTERGFALASATAQKAITKEAAREVLDRLLGNCVELNRSNWSPIRVSKVWLFGSLIDPGKTVVRDIDVVVETERLSEQLFEDAAKALGVTVDGWQHYLLPSKVERRLLYGKQRHSRFAPSDIETLRDLACPCQLIFDDMRGVVDDPILPKHPSATVTAAHMRDKLVFPDLSVGKKPLRPLRVELNEVEHEVLNLLGLLQVGPWPRDSQEYLTVLRRDRLYQVTTNGWRPRYDRVRTAPSTVLDHMDFTGCDGRGKFGLVGTEHFWTDTKGNRLDIPFGVSLREQVSNEEVMFALLAERSIQESARRVEYVFNLKDGDFIKLSGDDIDICVAWLHYIATADLEHIRRRDVESGISREMVVTVGKHDPFRSGIRSALAKSLQKPYIISGTDAAYPSLARIRSAR